MQRSARSIIINTGDYMQRISNDRLPSTTHRVGKPSDGSHLTAARVSFPVAVYVWEDELLEVLPELGEPKYPPVKAIAFHTRSTSKFYGDAYAVESARGVVSPRSSAVPRTAEFWRPERNFATRVFRRERATS